MGPILCSVGLLCCGQAPYKYFILHNSVAVTYILYYMTISLTTIYILERFDTETGKYAVKIQIVVQHLAPLYAHTFTKHEIDINLMTNSLRHVPHRTPF